MVFWRGMGYLYFFIWAGCIGGLEYVFPRGYGHLALFLGSIIGSILVSLIGRYMESRGSPLQHHEFMFIPIPVLIIIAPIISTIIAFLAWIGVIPVPFA